MDARGDHLHGQMVGPAHARGMAPSGHSTLTRDHYRPPPTGSNPASMGIVGGRAQVRVKQAVPLMPPRRPAMLHPMRRSAPVPRHP
jgi:hypothetical protein